MRSVGTRRRGNAVLYGSALVIAVGAGLWAWGFGGATGQGPSPTSGLPPEQGDGSHNEVDGPADPELSNVIDLAELIAVVQPVEPFESTTDLGTDTATGKSLPAGTGTGIPILMGWVEVTEVLYGDTAHLGTKIPVLMGDFDTEYRSRAAQRGPMPGQELIMVLDHAAARTTYLVDTDYYVPIGDSYGVIERQGEALTPWDSRLRTIGGVSVDQASTDDIVAMLEQSR